MRPGRALWSHRGRARALPALPRCSYIDTGQAYRADTALEPRIQQIYQKVPKVRCLPTKPHRVGLSGVPPIDSVQRSRIRH